MSVVIEPSTGLEATPERAIKIAAIRQRQKDRTNTAYSTFMENPTEENYQDLVEMLCFYMGSHRIRDKVW